MLKYIKQRGDDMSINPLDALFELGKSAIDKIWPDPIKRAEEFRLLEGMRQKGNLEELNAHVSIMLAQIKVNEVSAKHPSLFVSGARPAAIWAGVFSMSWAGIFHPLLTWVWAFTAMEGAPPPLIESAALSAIVTGLLGVGGMRSYDKTKGVNKDSL
jgi:hypothetical protein